MAKKIFLLTITFLLCTVWGFSSQNISFTAGATNVSFLGDDKEVELSNGASVKTSDVEITASNIKISGKDFSQINCSENVNIIDYKHNISIYSTSLSYDRVNEKIIIDGWVEMQDLNNSIAASAAWMEFDMNSGLLKMQIRAKILKDTSKGIMVCRADNITLNRDDETLILNGNSDINWDKDNYSADTIQVDLKTEDVKMIGKIKGKVNG